MDSERSVYQLEPPPPPLKPPPPPNDEPPEELLDELLELLPLDDDEDERVLDDDERDALVRRLPAAPVAPSRAAFLEARHTMMNTITMKLMTAKKINPTILSTDAADGGSSA